MPNPEESPQASSRTLSPRQRIISRLTSPFSPKARSVVEFYVQADDPHKQYSPGDLITGSVVLKIAKPIRLTHIVVSLHGYVQVYKTPNAPPAEPYRLLNTRSGGKRGTKSGAYFGDGFATLFEEEEVLCGDGRLAEGQYKFEFRLKFPDESMPSSIDFERGTVSYMLTAKLTRPTSISPTMYHDRKVYYVERIDVAPFLPPKPRTITLQPVVRRTRARQHGKKRSDQLPKRSADGSTSAAATQSMASSTCSTSVEDQVPRSQSPSTRSLESEISSNPPTSVSTSLCPVEHPEGWTPEEQSTLGHRTITATVESLKGGCLRGDNIPLKITVDHTKYIKSMNGVIVTLYRQARVDMHPILPLGPVSEGDKKRYEDYYPRSLTGLGGLSLSGAGSSHVFRKDLAQTMTPLIIDPNTLFVELRPKVRLPEEAFPTIASVPGEMISFKYYIEVILDIQGKLAGQDRYHYSNGGLPHLTSPVGLPIARDDAVPFGSGQNLYDSAIVDTAPIRRDKSVVTCTLEVVVGTHDSERKKSKGKAAVLPTEDEDDVNQDGLTERPNYSGQDFPGPDDWTQRGAVSNCMQYHNPAGYHHADDGVGFGQRQWHDDVASYDFLPPPTQDPDEGMSEKERMRRAEERLLPSQPPTMDHDGYDDYVPSAPYLEGEEEYLPPLTNTATARPAGSVGRDLGYAAEPGHNEPGMDVGPSAPSYMHLEAHDAAEQVNRVDDKQEMRRRELEMQASEPPPADDMPQDASSSAEQADVPTVPVEDGFDHVDDMRPESSSGLGNHYLPRYER